MLRLRMQRRGAMTVQASCRGEPEAMFLKRNASDARSLSPSLPKDPVPKQTPRDSYSTQVIDKQKDGESKKAKARRCGAVVE